MNRMLRIARFVLVLVLAAPLGGCFSFSGPSDIQRSLVRSGVELEREDCISVGPMGIFFANIVAAPYLPFSLDGVSSVDVGSYHIISASTASGAPFSVHDVELPGWETIVRVRDGGSSTAIMVDENGKTLRGVLVLSLEGDSLEIVRARGSLDKVLERAVEAVMREEGDLFAGGWEDVGASFEDMFDFDGG